MGKRIFASFVIGMIVAMNIGSFSRGFNRFLDNDSILTQDEDDVVGAEVKNSQEPLRDGPFKISENIDGIYNDQLTDTQTSREKTTRYIKGPINYFLGIVGLVALIYIIYHGFLTVTSGSNEEQQKKGIEGIKYGAIAIIGLGVARFLLSLIFWLINIVTEAV